MDTLSRSPRKSRRRLYVIMAMCLALALFVISVIVGRPHSVPRIVTVIIHTPTQSIEYKDVILQQDQRTYVTFLTKDGQQIEHTGAFSVIRKETSK